MELADEFEKDMHISDSLAAGESELLDKDDVLSLTSSVPTVSALLASSQDEQNKTVELKDVSERSQHVCPAYDLRLDWKLCPLLLTD